MEKNLQHFGVFGMRWGHRKGTTESSGTGKKAKSEHVGIWPKKPNKIIRILAQLPGQSNKDFDKEYSKAYNAEKKARREKEIAKQVDKAFKESLSMKEKLKWMVVGDPRIPTGKKIVETALFVAGSYTLMALMKKYS